jgi:hypothetical protein
MLHDDGLASSGSITGAEFYLSIFILKKGW